jgi:hypothetical protein
VTCSFAFFNHCLGALGPCWVREGVGVGVLEPVGEPLELVGKQMPVAVQRHRGRGVAELGLDRLDAGALGDEQARAGVAKVMEPQPVGESGPCRRRLGYRVGRASSTVGMDLPVVPGRRPADRAAYPFVALPPSDQIVA